MKESKLKLVGRVKLSVKINHVGLTDGFRSFLCVVLSFKGGRKFSYFISIQEKSELYIFKFSLQQ